MSKTQNNYYLANKEQQKQVIADKIHMKKFFKCNLSDGNKQLWHKQTNK